jgi:hypothetical protein
LCQVYEHLEKYHEKGKAKQQFKNELAEQKWTTFQKDQKFFGF